ncbi:MAG TPA: acetyl-CoA decarbonylase/synthase complex subunit delta [Methanoregulaceae archaeon]|mgnify:CR=1 FL=1|nr:MAG: acetyl-CoA decarbonylase/synthase complex subunit delta [Methanolinea sp.]HON81766.1 acetyl-CoA decarbonylase/synthase complex subunit delta [Methanoregulaceae archaeon]HPD10574.1 acetyl-CoA decarbonylase/synthase complex subunit delta [Methanoregulaceae archaeon]HRT15577.1 acetyl-CoA decarbonylase/synthase complex subunit delta [Methanoregulaceae archaeon]HRU31149.1 acetyl-CoA decarbonylase/synthase complex subunit delta [Methanoregulaceae archaeon]
MTVQTLSDWTGEVRSVTIGASRADGGTRTGTVTVGGERDLPFIGTPPTGHRPLVAYEICDDRSLWPAPVNRFLGDRASDPAEWARWAGQEYAPDLIRLFLTSTRKRGFSDFESVTSTVENVLQATGLPLIVEGSNDPELDSEVFRRIGEAGEGERLLIGTAEAGHYRSIAAAAMAFGHLVIAQSPIDINLAKQLNILLREIGLSQDRIVIDPYTGALGYGFEYSYSVMERIRTAALKGDDDLAMPMISSATDSLTVKEVREADPSESDSVSVSWELYAMLPAAVAGASIVCVRHPSTIAPLRAGIDALWSSPGGGG